MKIFRLYSPNRDYRTIKYEGTPLMSFLEDDNFDDYEAIENFQYQWDNHDKPICDCPFLIGAIPIIRKTALAKIPSVISNDLVKSIHIQIEGEPYEILLAKNILKDALNESKSIIDRFSDGRIMSIDKYVFKKNAYKPIFRIRQLPLFTFITDQLAESISKAHLTGLAMEECVILSKWRL